MAKKTVVAKAGKSPPAAKDGGCGTSMCKEPRVKVGPGARALEVDPEIKAANLRHLKRVEGQVRGISAMIADDRYCADIIIQTTAVQESLRSVAKNLLKNHLRHCASGALHGGGEVREKLIEEVLDLVGKIAR